MPSNETEKGPDGSEFYKTFDHHRTCANCGTITHEDDLCSCEGFCNDCHESHVSPSCEDVDAMIDKELADASEP